MSRRPSEGSAAVSEVTPPQTPADALAGVEFVTPMLQLAKAVLGPFLRHEATCTDDACGCGLTAAVADLKRRETLTQRYGTTDV